MWVCGRALMIVLVPFSRIHYMFCYCCLSWSLFNKEILTESFFMQRWWMLHLFWHIIQYKYLLKILTELCDRSCAIVSALISNGVFLHKQWPLISILFQRISDRLLDAAWNWAMPYDRVKGMLQVNCVAPLPELKFIPLSNTKTRRTWHVNQRLMSTTRTVNGGGNVNQRRPTVNQ